MNSRSKGGPGAALYSTMQRTAASGGARSGDRTPSCGAYEGRPSHLAQREVVRVGGIEPPLSCARGMRFSGLSYTLMATRRGFDPLSPVRQTGRLARCVTGQIGVRGAI